VTGDTRRLSRLAVAAGTYTGRTSSRRRRSVIPGPHRRAARVDGIQPGRRRHLPAWPLLAALVGELSPVRRGRRGPPLHAVPRPQGSCRHCVPITIPAWPRTTFRCVSGEATRSRSSRLRRSPRLTGPSTAPAKLSRLMLTGIARATVVHSASVPSPLPKAMNRATRGVTVHAHTLRPCHALCEPHR